MFLALIVWWTDLSKRLPTRAEALIAGLDDLAIATPQVAQVCSGSLWQWAAHQRLHGERELIIREEQGHLLALAKGPLFEGAQHAFQPLESAWCFANPMLGPHIPISLNLLRATIAEHAEAKLPWVIGGIAEGGTLHGGLQLGWRRSRRLRFFPGTDCLIAHLDGGMDGWLSRRSAKFRAGLKQTERKASKAGITLTCDFGSPQVDPATGQMQQPGTQTFRRILAVDKRTWKYAGGESIFIDKAHRSFYRDMVHGAAARGQLRAVFAQHEGRDVAFCFGVILGDTYRGFQLGFDERYRDYALGNLCQYEMLQLLSAEGIRRYDLGMSIDYKRRWAEEEVKFINAVIFP